MKQFEYKEVNFVELKVRYDTQLDVVKLNLLGLEGWELIGVFSGMCVFKREVN